MRPTVNMGTGITGRGVGDQNEEWSTIFDYDRNSALRGAWGVLPNPPASVRRTKSKAR